MTREEWSVIQNVTTTMRNLQTRITYPEWRKRFPDDHAEWMYLRDFLRPQFDLMADLWHLHRDPEVNIQRSEYCPPVQMELFDNSVDPPETWDHY